MRKTVHPHPMLHAAAAACAAAALCLPSFAAAADIAWTSTRISATMATGKRTSESQAVFTNGDKADVSGACSSGPLDDKGWATSICEAEFRFADGSRILMSFNVTPRREDAGGECHRHVQGRQGTLRGHDGHRIGGRTHRQDAVDRHVHPAVEEVARVVLLKRERGVVGTPLFTVCSPYFTCSREMYSISDSTRERTYWAESYGNSP